MWFKSHRNGARRVSILGVGVDPINLEAAVARVQGWIAARDPAYGIFRDAHGVVACQKDPQLMRIHREAGLVGADGMPLFWLTRLRRGGQAGRVCGRDFMTAFVRAGTGKGYRHFFYGSTPEVVEDLIAGLRRIDPGIIVTGQYSPPFRPLTESEKVAAIEAINVTRPDVVWVGLSTPKQEFWMAEQLGQVAAPALLGVGAAFDFIAGTKPHASKWVQQLGLEWLFRMATEPRRLACRYLDTVPIFVLLVIAQALRLKRFDAV